MLYSEYGRASFAVLLFQDLAVVPLLALVPLLAAPTLSVGAAVAMLLSQSGEFGLDFEATENIVAALHQAYPDVTILARGHDADHCRTLRKLGARIAVSETLETSLELAREVLIRDDSDTARVEALLRRFHQEHYNNLDAAKTREASDRTGA